MSLVNEMLQDLQQRKAADSTPLAGLRAVPARAREARPKPTKKAWIVALTVIVVAVPALLWFRNDHRVETLQAETITVKVEPAPVAGPVAGISAPAVARGSGLETNRLDYRLHAPPSLKIPVPPVTNVKPVALSAQAQPDAGPSGATRVTTGAGGTSEIVFKTPVSPAVRLRRDGLAALRKGRAVLAEQQFARLVAAEPDNPEAYLFLHAALQAQSRSAAARTTLLDGLQRTSEPAQLAELLAYELLAEGRVNDALAVLTTHRPAGHSDLDYEAKLAAVNQRAGQHAVAAELYGLLVARQPANGIWWVGLAISQEAMGHAGDAAKSFATATAGGTLDATLARYAAQRLERLETGS